MASQAIAWVKESDHGAEFADVLIARERLTATGLSIGAAPVGYRLDYKLETDHGFTTLGLLVTARGAGWNRTLDLRRNRRGKWSVRTKSEGDADLPAPGGDTRLFSEALDCDLGLSPTYELDARSPAWAAAGWWARRLSDGLGFRAGPRRARQPAAIHVHASRGRGRGRAVRIARQLVHRRHHLCC